ncbi:maleylpyruvate isomerase [Actinoplanes lutulentus]|nr:maleylpyruvate isomerase family mycothiol-dependent enzyme [Actinoplanes lutulentus]MBB2941520.1 maleylpyruvate isomerase [Actinoplanes lutulentus]
MTMDPLVLMTDVEESTDALLRDAESWDDGVLAEPSGLPGWSVGHVLTHLARNADALTNLLVAARTGAEAQLYASRAARDEAIESGSGRPLAEQLDDLRAAHDRFADAAASMPASAWFTHLPAIGQSAAGVPWGRLREIEVHRVDLARDYTAQEWTDAFALRLLREFVAQPPADAPAMVLRPLGLEHPLTIGDSGPVIGGPTKSLAGWLIGRADGTDLTVAPDGELPKPARWK